MTKLVITRGLPGSGKTSWARLQPGWRVNRDDLRRMVLPAWEHGNSDLEDMLTRVQHGAIRSLLIRDHDVVVDDTNLRPDVVDELRSIARAYGAEFHIEDFTHVPVEECVARDAARPESERVGAPVIWGMWGKYLAPPAAEESGRL